MPNKTFSPIPYAVLSLLLLAGSVHAETWYAVVGKVGGPGSRLGSSIAVRSTQGPGGPVDRIYVGTPNQPFGDDQEVGGVSVYTPDPANVWKLRTSIVPTVKQAGEHFGASLAVNSDGTLIIGAPDFNDTDGLGANAGRVEFWHEDVNSDPITFTFVNSINGSGGNFGSAVAIDDDMAAVAKVNANSGNGCVSGFHFDPVGQYWANLPALNDVVCGSSGAALGSSIDIVKTSADSYRLIAGAPGETHDNNSFVGGAHVYIPNTDTSTGGLVEVGTLAADTPGAFEFFGTSVGIDNNYAYVGATGRDNGTGRVGSVTIFERKFIGGYDYLQEYFPSDPATDGGHCGASLSVDRIHSQFILGCPDSAGLTEHEGSARVYKQATLFGSPVWLESVLAIGISHYHGLGGDQLGTSVALSGAQAFAGAPSTSYPDGKTNKGSWWEFRPDKIFANGFE
jgi:hypothetical protein